MSDELTEDLDKEYVKENPQQALFELNDLAYQKEWQDMPEFSLQDKEPYKQVIVSFRSEKDMEEFAKLVGQKITDRTQSLWFPKATIEQYINKRYSAE
jgi:hypothetical protein